MFDYLIKKNHLEHELLKYDINPVDVIFIKEMILKPPNDTVGTWPYQGRHPEKGFLYQVRILYQV